jgi:hypothetical protein
MEPTLEQVRTELAEIHEELIALPPEDFGHRADLRTRQNELRQLSGELIQGEPLHNRKALEAAYTRLQDVRDRLLEHHLSHSSTSVGDAGIDSAFVNAVNKAMDSGLGLDDVEARIGEILAQLRSSR